MDYHKLLTEKVSLLKAKGAEVTNFKINKGIAADKVKKIEELIRKKIPEDLLKFYNSVNGFALNWELSVDEGSLAGFWDIWPLEKVYFGQTGRLSEKNLENTFEDVLWSDYFEEKEINELKTHNVLESVEGQSAFVTFKVLENKVSLFYVNEGETRQIPLSLEEYLSFIIESYGTESVRSDMQEKNFFKKPMSKPYLKQLNAQIQLNLPQIK